MNSQKYHSFGEDDDERVVSGAGCFNRFMSNMGHSILLFENTLLNNSRSDGDILAFPEC